MAMSLVLVPLILRDALHEVRLSGVWHRQAQHVEVLLVVALPDGAQLIQPRLALNGAPASFAHHESKVCRRKRLLSTHGQQAQDGLDGLLFASVKQQLNAVLFKGRAFRL